MKHSIVALIVALCCCLPGMAKTNKQKETENYKKGIELMEEYDFEGAREAFLKDVALNSKSGFSHGMLAMLYSMDLEYEKSLEEAQLSIKYLPKNETKFLEASYYYSALAHESLGDTVAALECYDKAIEYNPENTVYHCNRGLLYYELGQLENSIEEYRKAIAKDQGNDSGYIGLARSLHDMGRYDEAIEQLNIISTLAPDNEDIYKWRAACYIKKGDLNKATDDIIKGIEGDNYSTSDYLMSRDEELVRLLEAKLKIMVNKEKTDFNLPVYLAMLYENNGRPDKAVECYKKSLDRGASQDTWINIANEYDKMGDYSRALLAADKCVKSDSMYLTYKTVIMYHAGLMDEALTILDNIIKENEKETSEEEEDDTIENDSLEVDFENIFDKVFKDYDTEEAYLQKADIYFAQKNYQGVVESLDKVLEMNIGMFCYNYYRGLAYKAMGQEDKARECFMNMADMCNDEYCKYGPAACYMAGEKEKAEVIYRKIMEKDSLSNIALQEGIYLACARGDEAEALAMVKHAIDKGYVDLGEFEWEPAISMLQDNKEFKQLMSDCRKRFGVEENVQHEEIADGETIEIPVSKKDGSYIAKCSINGLPVTLAYDPSASDVKISDVDASFMLKNDYIERKEVSSVEYVDEYGNMSAGAQVLLKKITLGGLELTNVKALVANTSSVSIILGPKALHRLGKAELDTTRMVLRITLW